MKKIGWLVYLLIVVIGVCLGNDDNYKNYYLEDPNLCSAAQLKQGKIKLDELTAARLLNKRSKHNFLCRIKVKTTDKSNGIIAVIQKLDLRRNDTSGQCIDYVKFISEGGVVSRKHCGKLKAKRNMNHLTFITEEPPTMASAENAFLNNIGENMIVDIFISELDPSTDYTPTNIDIAFTLYSKCRYGMSGFVPCLDNVDVCIKAWYFNDKIINCPYVGCVDEGGCGEQSTYNDKLSIGSKVIISSMSSLVISFIVFVICIYLCRKYKKLCWSEDWSQPQQSSEAQPPRVIEMREQPSQSQEQSDDRNVEKDLPPSYDSLFPDR